MSDDTGPDDLEMMTDFLYLAPVGLMRFQPDGSVDLANPMVAQLLMPLAPDGDLSNAYNALGTVAPDLARRLKESPVTSGIVLDHERYAATAGTQRSVLSLTVHRIDQGSLIAVIEDVTAQAEQERQLQETKADLTLRRHHDSLTGLANRSLLDIRLAEAEPGSEEKPTLLFLDIIGAKAANDTKEFSPGDPLLVGIAERLAAVAGSDNLVARLTGDHFVVLCRGMDDDAVASLGARVQEAFAAPFDVAGETCQVSAVVALAGVGQAAGLDRAPG